MNKTINNRAWFLVLPVFLLVAFNALIPLMTVVNYSVQETFGNNIFFWSGVTWFQDVLRDAALPWRARAAVPVHRHHPPDRDAARRRHRARHAATRARGSRSASC